MITCTNIRLILSVIASLTVALIREWIQSHLGKNIMLKLLAGTVWSSQSENTLSFRIVVVVGMWQAEP